MRIDGRKPEQIREIKIYPEVIRHAEGSAEIHFGKTRLICTATVENNLPKWLQNSGQGWVTAEYGMLPRSTHTRIQREKSLNGGRSQEISRLIGRSLRASIDLKELGERQITVDCDVIEADGGTRTAAISGGFVALALALQFLKNRGDLKELPLRCYVAAVSVGLVREIPLLDLNYDEDSSCGTDMNFVITNHQRFVEIQGTGEGSSFTQTQMEQMAKLAFKGCEEIFLAQEKVLKKLYPRTYFTHESGRGEAQ
ncbi:MAG: ribonuclease PH [Bdellovibrionales bacterium]|nr:ribonuclease PH [Bdellovibrionales bacterium]